MAIQMLGNVAYAPSRDIVYLWPHIVRTVAERLEDGPFEPLHEWLKSQGVSLDDLGDGVGAYIAFLQEADSRESTSLTEALEKSGWKSVRWEVQLAVMFYAGSIITGSFFSGIREANKASGQEIISVAAAVRAGKMLDRYMAMPAWKRWLLQRCRPFSRLIWRSEGVYDI